MRLVKKGNADRKSTLSLFEEICEVHNWMCQTNVDEQSLSTVGGVVVIPGARLVWRVGKFIKAPGERVVLSKLVANLEG